MNYFLCFLPSNLAFVFQCIRRSTIEKRPDNSHLDNRRCFFSFFPFFSNARRLLHFACRCATVLSDDAPFFSRFPWFVAGRRRRNTTRSRSEEKAGGEKEEEESAYKGREDHEEQGQEKVFSTLTATGVKYNRMRYARTRERKEESNQINAGAGESTRDLWMRCLLFAPLSPK